MPEIVDRTFEMFIMFIVGLAIGGCFMFCHMKDKGVHEEKVEITNTVLTENDIEKIRYEGKQQAEELMNRIENNSKKENEILAIAEAKVKAGIPFLKSEMRMCEKSIWKNLTK